MPRIKCTTETSRLVSRKHDKHYMSNMITDLCNRGNIIIKIMHTQFNNYRNVKGKGKR